MTQLAPMAKLPKAHYMLKEPHALPASFSKLSTRLKELATMLTYARPDDSDTENEFIELYIDTLPRVTKDAYGNRFVQVGKDEPNICWASHTDTVHYDEGRQSICIDQAGHIALDVFSQASCLGADCTAGVWLMRRMILAGKHGLYIFHRGEECGGLGANFILKHSPQRFKNIDAVISLDRRGYTSVITRQYDITASKAFARSLADMLPEGFKPDDTGTFTDSAVYRKIVSECSNVSIGYHNQHSEKESLDFRFTDTLLTALLKLNYEQLIFDRDHTAPDTDEFYDDYYQHNYGGPYDDTTWDTESKYNGLRTRNTVSGDLADLVGHYPEAASLLLAELGASKEDLLAIIDDVGC